MAAIDEFPFLSSLPVGCGFRPTEEELITHYLKNKILGQEFLVRFIKEIDLYKFDPEQLPDKSYFPSSNFEWFFFRANTSNNKRTTATGGWRSTGDPRRIKARETNEVIATCHIYVFHRGKGGNAIKTNWVIHEYKLHTLTDITSQPFIIFRLKKNAEERHVSIRDQEDGQNSTVASHRTKKVKRGGEIREINRDEQSICKPLGSCTQQPVNAYDDNGEVNMQPIQLGDGDSAYGNMTEFINKTVIWDDIFNHEVTSNMCGSLRRSEPQPGLMDTQQSESQLDYLRNFVHDDKNWDEMTSNNQEWEGMYCQFQGGFSSETNSNTAFGLPYNHTMKRLERTPLPPRRLRLSDVEKHIEIGNSPQLSGTDSNNELKSEAGNKATKWATAQHCCSSKNRFSYILTTKRIHHNSTLPSLVYVAKALLGVVVLVMFAQDVLLYRYRR
ncbi:NAC domain-containing protein 96-like [Cucurbita pepo subsp. pepo]|uniref:NAC domain-containing protein 96-like n=2 Tax=Cucurbita pepo subsp. pepo TaxID=3664 RepID=UPI000C9D3FA1|nr:NAC domain-containing protein 96-like [Cucurbita pepo subsp. pepo]